MPETVIKSTGPVESTGPVTLSEDSVVEIPISKGQSQHLDPSKPATTTFQEDLTTAGQRQINLIWERTQAVIAIAVVLFTMIAGVIAMLYNLDIPSIISVAFGMVTGFYFSRTNHAAIGGVGRKPVSELYVGR